MSDYPIVNVVILAAGHGTRMRSDLPKVLHKLGGLPLVEYSLRLAAKLGSQTPVVVVGHGAEAVCQTVGERARFAIQEQQLGTAHALLSAAPLLEGQDGLVVVLSADMPLFRSSTFCRLMELQGSNPGPISMLTVFQDDSHGFGRILRGADGSVQAIIEEAHASPEQLAIKEVNVGGYCFVAGWLWQALHRIPVSTKGEYYLTDAIGLAVQEGQKVQAYTMTDATEAMGINTRLHLAEAEMHLRRRINTAWMVSGVTMIDPDSTYIEPDVQIGRDTIIYPNTHLRGHTKIEGSCELGPNSILTDCQVTRGCRVVQSMLENQCLEPGTVVTMERRNGRG